MNQRTLARCAVGAVTLLQVIALSLPGTDAGPYEGISATDTGFQAGSHPLGPVVALTVFALYLWVLHLPQEPPRHFIAASLWRKPLAIVTDLLLAIWLVAPWSGFIAISVEALRSGYFAWQVHRDHATDADFLLSSLLVFCSLLCLLLYYAWAQHRGRPTPGDLLLGIELKYRDEQPLSLWRALGRVSLGYIAMCACFVSVPMALRDPEKRMWQDKAFGTRVVQWTD